MPVRSGTAELPWPAAVASSLAVEAVCREKGPQRSAETLVGLVRRLLSKKSPRFFSADWRKGMAVRKTTIRGSTTRKTTTKKTTPKKTGRSARARLESELSPNLRDFSRRVRRGLARLEKKLDTARRDGRRRWTRLLRDASHQLGRIEAEGERRWRKQSRLARRDAVRMLQRLERAIEPPRARKAPRKKTVRRAGGELSGSGI